MMLPSSWAVAQYITGGHSKAAFVAVSALAFAAWDLFLDPQMVGWELWTWETPATFHYFGIPLANYAGWLLAAALITVLPPTAPRTIGSMSSVTLFLRHHG
jgi:putative membrane protein